MRFPDARDRLCSSVSAGWRTVWLRYSLWSCAPLRYGSCGTSRCNTCHLLAVQFTPACSGLSPYSQCPCRAHTDGRSHCKGSQAVCFLSARCFYYLSSYLENSSTLIVADAMLWPVVIYFQVSLLVIFY